MDENKIAEIRSRVLRRLMYRPWWKKLLSVVVNQWRWDYMAREARVRLPGLVFEEVARMQWEEIDAGRVEEADDAAAD